MLLNILAQLINPDFATNEIAPAVDDASDAVKMLENLSVTDAISHIANNIVEFAFKLLLAIVVFYVGKFIIRKIYKVCYTLMVRRNVDASLTTFVLSLIRMVLYFILIITIIGILGIETSSFLALFASAGVAVGMALSGTLQNFAGGVLILLLKPYKVGDYIEAQGYAGTVKAIQIFHTVINTIDNKAIIIPNGGLSTGSINNYSLEQYRRVDWKVSLAYGTDYEAAKNYILGMLAEDERVVKQYVEDDINYRNGIEQKEDNNGVEVVEKKKEGWLKRYIHRRRQRNAEIEQHLQRQQTMHAGLPVKRDCTPFVGLSEMADSSIVLTVRAWTHSSNYWPLYFKMSERFYTELPKAGFSFPFPQLDVHMIQ